MAEKKKNPTKKRAPRGAFKKVTVPDSLDRFVRETNCTECKNGYPGEFIDQEGPGRGGVIKCNVWLPYTATRCGLVSDCDTYTYEEFVRVARRVAAAANSGTQDICNWLGCKRRFFRRVRWSWTCNRRLLCVTVRVEFICLN